MATDPLDPRLLRRENRQQLLSDILRNARGAPEAALTMGTALADMAGTGLGTLAGMAKQRLSGEDVNLDAAAEGMQEGRFTYAPRTTGGQETLRGLETVTAPLEKGMQWAGQKTADVTGSPAAGAAVYTALNVLDPELLAPGAAKIAALRGAQNVARSAKFEPVSSAGIGGKQRGAWSPGDIADVEGDFTMRSTVEDALGKLKPQEQKARGKQMLAVLKKYGAKEDELRWSGLADALASDVPVTVDEIRAHMAEQGVQVEPSRRGTSGPEVEKGASEIDEDAMREKISDLVNEDSDLQYPVSITRDGEHIDTFDTWRDAERALEEAKRDLVESETEYYLENIEEHFEPDELAEMSDDQKQAWAEEAAADAADNYKWEIETDYDAEPTNYDELYNYWQREVERRPQDYGLGPGGGGQESKWGEYVIEGPGGTKGENYGETIMRLTREGRYGRGVPFDEYNTPAGLDQMTPFQRARYEALKKAKTDPMTQAAARNYEYRTHFPEQNPLVYTREDDWPKPPGATTEGSMRVVQELQSDWGQQGRKKGIMDPEEARAKAEKLAASLGGKVDKMRQDALEQLRAVPQRELAYLAERRGFRLNPDEVNMDNPEALAAAREGKIQDLLSSVNERIAGAASPEEALLFLEDLGNDLYYAADTREAENIGTGMRTAAQTLRREAAGESQGLPPAPFIGDAKKFSQLALQQAIADAVQRGDQYVGVSPGYVHSPERWGTEDLSWWETPVSSLPGQQAPQLRTVAAKSGSYDKTRGEEWKAKIAALRKDPAAERQYGDPETISINLEDPEALTEVERLVRSNLAYEAPQYADPEAFIRARAAKILDNMRKEAEGQYSPRAHGMAEFYDKIAPGVLEKILKEAGSTGSGKGVQRMAEAPRGYGYGVGYQRNPDTGEWQAKEIDSMRLDDDFKRKASEDPDNFRYEPPRIHFVEIDPELARAAKRGFRLPF